MASSTQVSSKKTSVMVTVSLRGKTAESTKVTGSKESSTEKVYIETPKEKKEEAFGKKESVLVGLTKATIITTM